MKRISAVLIFLAAMIFPATVCAQAYTTITASDMLVDNGSGTAVNPPAGSSLCFLGVNSAGAAVTYTPSGGSPVTGAVCQTLTSGGALTGSLQVANPATASPNGLYYTITVTYSGTTYLTIPTVALSGYVFAADTQTLPGTGTALGIGAPHLSCTYGAQWTSTTYPLGQQNSVCNASGNWAASNYCPSGTAYVIPQSGGTPFCLAPQLNGSGSPVGLCTNNSTYLQPNGSAWVCVSGAWTHQNGCSPNSIANGCTGATTAPGALNNLGGVANNAVAISTPLLCADNTTSSIAYVCSTSTPSVDMRVPGTLLIFTMNRTSGASPTLSVNGYGPNQLVDQNANPIQAGEIEGNGYYLLSFGVSGWELIGKATVSQINGGGTGATTAAGANLAITGVTQTGALGTSSQKSTFPGVVAIGAADTALSRDSAGVIDVGTGAVGDTSGSIKLTNLTASGNVAAQTVVSDVYRNGTRYFDVRAKGAVCNGVMTGNVWSGTDDTAAFQTASALFPAHIQIPTAVEYSSSCSIQPGPSTGPAAWSFPAATLWLNLEGAGKSLSTIQDETNTGSGSNAPLLQIGTLNGALGQNSNLKGFFLRGAYGVSYPNGVLFMGPSNLSYVNDVWVGTGTGSTNSYALMARGGTVGWGEMLFDGDLFGGSAQASDTCFSVWSPGSNTNVSKSSVEGCGVGIDFRGTSGTPILTWTGGHVENSYTTAALVQQAQLHMTGTNVSAGMIYLDSSTIGSTIDIGSSAAGWNTPIVDNGVGNKINLAGSSAQEQGQSLNLNGSEQYNTPNLVADPLFMATGASAWSRSSAAVTLTTNTLTSPGAKAGQAIQIVSTTATDYAYQTVSVTPNAEYELVMVANFIGSSSASATVSVYDTASGTTIYTGALTPTIGFPASGGNDWAYRVLRAWVPASSTASTWQIRVTPGVATWPVLLTYFGLNPSSTTMAAGVPASSGSGTATCTSSSTYSSYLSATCALSGRGGGGSYAQASWTLASPTYPTGAFLRFHAVTGVNSVNPRVQINGGFIVQLQSNRSMDYNIPLGYWPGSLVFQDNSGPTTDPNDLVISQVSAVPWYANGVIPVTTTNDGQFVTGITPNGQQHRATPTVIYIGVDAPFGVLPAASTITGNSGNQPLYTWPGISLAAGKCMRLTAGAQRITGTDSVTFSLYFGGTLSGGVVSGGTALGAWTSTATGTTPFPLHAMVCNVSSSSSSQVIWTDAYYINTAWGAAGSVGSASVPLGTAGTFYLTVNAPSTSSFTPKGAVLELIQ